MRSLGYCVGHERLGALGTSSWIWAFRETYRGEVSDPRWYEHVVVQHRHPLRVINSGLNTHFNPLAITGPHTTFSNITRPRILQAWPSLVGCEHQSLALLAWWQVWTRAAMKIKGALLFPIKGAHYETLLPKIGIEMTRQERTRLDRALTTAYNKHTSQDFGVTWKSVQRALGHCPEASDMLHAAKALAVELGYHKK